MIFRRVGNAVQEGVQHPSPTDLGASQPTKTGERCVVFGPPPSFLGASKHAQIHAYTRTQPSQNRKQGWVSNKNVPSTHTTNLLNAMGPGRNPSPLALNSIDPERRTDKQTACCIGLVRCCVCGAGEIARGGRVRYSMSPMEPGFAHALRFF